MVMGYGRLLRQGSFHDPDPVIMITYDINADGVERSLDQFEQTFEDTCIRAIETESDEILARARAVHRFESRTYNLVGSLYAYRQEHAVEFGINNAEAPYGKYIHNGTRRWPADPFLREAIDYYNDGIIRQITLSIDDMIRRVGL